MMSTGLSSIHEPEGVLQPDMVALRAQHGNHLFAACRKERQGLTARFHSPSPRGQASVLQRFKACRPKLFAPIPEQSEFDVNDLVTLTNC